MKKILILSLASLSFIACKQKENQAQQTETPQPTETAQENSEKTFIYHPRTTKLTWTAYKTPEKVGVKGTFDEIEVSNTQQSLIKEEVLSGATFKINSISVNSGDDSRDDKIKNLFFKSMTSTEINGKFGEFNNGIVPITLTMNGKEITKDFNYTFSDDEIIITGTIDILQDFDISKGFTLLHDACKELHQDKTWTDVSIEVITKL